MAQAGIKLVGDIYAMELVGLQREFGSWAQRLYELGRGIDTIQWSRTVYESKSPLRTLSPKTFR